jgi:cytoskeletal protein RodZ
VPSVGEQLRQAREQQGLSFQHLGELTKIKTDHLRALEESNWDAFSAPVYIKGFVRTYAQALHLDAAALSQELDAELRRTTEFAAPPALTVRRSGPLDWLMLQFSKVRWQWVFPILLTAALGGAAYWGIHWWQTRPRTKSTPALGNTLYQSRPIPQREALPIPTNLPPAAPQPRNGR